MNETMKKALSLVFTLLLLLSSPALAAPTPTPMPLPITEDVVQEVPELIQKLLDQAFAECQRCGDTIRRQGWQ